MKYLLRNSGIRQHAEITRAEFETLKESKKHYSQIIRVEENFDAVMEDYVELEDTLHHFALRYLAFHSMEHEQFQAMRNIIGRRIVHLLATSRLYRDALKKHGKALLSANEAFGELKSAITDSKGQPMAFRMIETLRNYCQHEELPISSMTAGSRWEGDKDVAKGRAAFSVTPKINALKVGRGRGVPKDVRDALAKLGEQAEMISHIRQFIEHLGAIHALFRKLVSDKEKKWSEAMHAGMDKYKQAVEGGDKVPVIVAVRHDDENILEQVQLFDEFFDYRRRLRRKNGSQMNSSKRYVKWSGLMEL